MTTWTNTRVNPYPYLYITWQQHRNTIHSLTHQVKTLSHTPPTPHAINILAPSVTPTYQQLLKNTNGHIWKRPFVWGLVHLAQGDNTYQTIGTDTITLIPYNITTSPTDISSCLWDFTKKRNIPYGSRSEATVSHTMDTSSHHQMTYSSQKSSSTTWSPPQHKVHHNWHHFFTFNHTFPLPNTCIYLLTYYHHKQSKNMTSTKLHTTTKYTSAFTMHVWP